MRRVLCASPIAKHSTEGGRGGRAAEAGTQEKRRGRALESTRSERRSPSLYRVEHHVELTEDLVILILVCEKVHTVGEIRAPQHKKKHGVRVEN